MTVATLDGYSPSQAARALGLSPSRVHQLLEAGELTYTRTPLGRVVDRRSVELLRARRGRPGESPPEA